MDRMIDPLLEDLARALEHKMLEIGLDPRDAQDVEAFVNGCRISKRVKLLIVDSLDNE